VNLSTWVGFSVQVPCNACSDVMEMMMPLIGCNQAYQYGNPRSHQWFEQWEAKGDYTMRYFIEPVALAAAYAKKLGYKHVVMLGLSGVRVSSRVFFILFLLSSCPDCSMQRAWSAVPWCSSSHLCATRSACASQGGWTTTVASAVVTEISLSIPTAGSTPKWPTKTYPHWYACDTCALASNNQQRDGRCVCQLLICIVQGT
jgi:hypothetical protein